MTWIILVSFKGILKLQLDTELSPAAFIWHHKNGGPPVKGRNGYLSEIMALSNQFTEVATILYLSSYEMSTSILVK